CKSVPFPETSPEELYREEPRRVDVAPGEMPEPQTPGEEPRPAAEEPLPEMVPPTEEIPSEVIPGEFRLSEGPEYGELPEPEPDLAEASLPELDLVFPEEAVIAPLPEPIPLALFPEPEPVPAAEPAPPSQPVPAAEAEPAVQPVPAPEPVPAPTPEPEPVPAPEPAPSPAPVPKPEPVPSPPRSLRPAEPLPPPAVVREKPPVPVNPIPDLPPQSPQSVLRPPIETEEDLTFSRVVRATVGQLVEIPFRGTGWVFLGELGARRGIAYGSRRLDPEGQSFIFRAEEAGTYALKFYKQDFIRDYILNDYVQVIIGEAPEPRGTAYFNPPVDRGRVVAEPRWPLAPGEASGSRSPAVSAGTGGLSGGVPQDIRPEPVPPMEAAPGRGGLAPPLPAETASPLPAAGPPAAGPPAAGSPALVVVPPAAQPPSDPGRDGSFPRGTAPEGYVNRAREEYDAGRVASALSILDQFREAYPAGSDEAWWLYGQLLEANGPQRDIRSALDYYRRLIREYPQSSRFDEARRRIAYLERYYFTIQ
ncbi:MAG: hypothetical protein LBC60_12400, partial [Spirochaetaceae bacterium]|nr:hypothetical protein [Spirochaetaceae bacterium]